MKKWFLILLLAGCGPTAHEVIVRPKTCRTEITPDRWDGPRFTTYLTDESGTEMVFHGASGTAQHMLVSTLACGRLYILTIKQALSLVSNFLTKVDHGRSGEVEEAVGHCVQRVHNP